MRSIGKLSVPSSTSLPYVGAHGGVDGADLLHRAGAEGHADVIDALQRVQVEVELGGEAPEAAHVDDPPQHRRRLHGLIGEPARDLVDGEVHALAARGVTRLLDPAGVGGVQGEVRAELAEPCAPAGIARGSEHRARALEAGDLDRHDSDARACALDQDGLASSEPAVGDERIVHGLQRDGERCCLDHVGCSRGYGADAAPVGDGVFGVAAGARAHDPVAGPELGHLCADRGNFTGPFEARDRARAAERPVGPPCRHDQVCPVQAAGGDPDQDLIRSRLWHRHVADRQTFVAKHHCFHSSSPMGFGPGVPKPPNASRTPSKPVRPAPGSHPHLHPLYPVSPGCTGVIQSRHGRGIARNAWRSAARGRGRSRATFSFHGSPAEKPREIPVGQRKLCVRCRVSPVVVLRYAFDGMVL